LVNSDRRGRRTVFEAWNGSDRRIIDGPVQGHRRIARHAVDLVAVAPIVELSKAGANSRLAVAEHIPGQTDTYGRRELGWLEYGERKFGVLAIGDLHAV